MSPGSLVIRADASVAIGTGHLMRCLALAQAWQDAGGKAVFAMAESTRGLIQKLSRESCEMVSLSSSPGTPEDARGTMAAAKDYGAEWVVVDGYHFDSTYQGALKAAGLKVLLLDDYANAEQYAADVIVNQNPLVKGSSYRNKVAHSEVLVGSEYVLLRREFRKWTTWTREFPEKGKHIVVAMGGTDPDNLTLRVLEVLPSLNIDGLKIVVVVGAGNPFSKSIKESAERLGNSIQILTDPPEMANIIASSDVAMIAAGGTLWEVLFMQCAALSYARNEGQAAIVDHLSAQGAVVRMNRGETEREDSAVDLLQTLIRSRDLRQKLATKGRQIVDGRGAERIVSFLLSEGSR